MYEEAIEKSNHPMIMVTCLMPKRFIKGLDVLVDADLYASRSEAIRTAVIDLLRDELWEKLIKVDSYQNGATEKQEIAHSGHLKTHRIHHAEDAHTSKRNGEQS